MKFGGTSVGSTERIGNVAKRVVSHIKATGEQVVLVVSAMAGETDRLVELCRKVSGTDSERGREYDQLAASGEQVSSALMALALKREGQAAQSMLAHQLPLRTKRSFGLNLIDNIDTKKLKELISQNIVPVIAGFQGVDEEGNFTTLGRGGSDTTAVAIAAALGSCPCFIYTDVDGVYTALPQVCKKARRLDYLTYEEMLEMASSGAKVLQTRSVSLAKKYNLPLIVASSFSQDFSLGAGTRIVEEYKGMEHALVSGISAKGDQVKVTLRNIPDSPGIAAVVFRAIADKGIIVDEIAHVQATGGKTNLTFTIDNADAAKTQETLSALVAKDFGDAGIDLTRNLAMVSVVGEGMRNSSGVAAQVFEVLGKEGVNIEMITTSEIKISVAIQQKYSELAQRALHEFFIESSQH